mgnify:CR=1 FL=1
MLSVLSPAKALDMTPAPLAVASTQPALMTHTTELMKTTKKLSKKAIAELMHLSDDLAKLNHQRFRSFELPFTDDNAMPAAFMFNGDVYKGLDARSLDDGDLDFAQDHLLILSGLYGLLRPKDLMQAYRLEMGTKLQNPRGKSLYAFWGEHITDELNNALAAHDDDTLVNLASNEYFKSVKPKKLNSQIVTCVFEDWKTHPDEGKVISFKAKVARGSMARFIIQERIDRRAGLKDFNVGGYTFRDDRSSDDKYVFSRKFVPAAAQR